MDVKLHEKCAVVGVFDPNAATLTSAALSVLDHRGSGSTGVGGLTKTGTFELFRASGAAHQVFTPEKLAELQAWGLAAAIGHDRYATSGPVDKHHQPVAAGAGDMQIYFAQNGNLSFLDNLESDLKRRHINPAPFNDTEMAGQALADRVLKGASLPDAAADLYPLLVGAHSSVAVGKGPDGKPMLIAFRDSCGIRPLVLGKTAHGYMVASETVGLDAADATFVRDIEPGEMIMITSAGITSRQLATPTPKFDMFELIYFASPKSLFKGVPIASIREAFGRQLGAEYGPAREDSLVIGVPESAKPFAEGFAAAQGLEYSADAIVKNPTVGRSFMQPTKAAREALRNIKYKFDQSVIAGRHIIAVDDSIVRNNTARFVTDKLLEAGALSVSIAIGSPPIRFPNFYGIDTPQQRDLPASHKSIEQIRADVGCKQLYYLSLEGMLAAAHKATGEPGDHFELSCFTGEYPVAIGTRGIRVPDYALAV